MTDSKLFMLYLCCPWPWTDFCKNGIWLKKNTIISEQGKSMKILIKLRKIILSLKLTSLPD